MNKIVKGMIAMGFALGMANSAFSAEALKLGYLVKQPEEPWFQTEWNFADKAGKDLGLVAERAVAAACVLADPVVGAQDAVGLPCNGGEGDLLLAL